MAFKRYFMTKSDRKRKSDKKTLYLTDYPKVFCTFAPKFSFLNDEGKGDSECP